MTETTAALELAEVWRARGIPVFPCRLWHDGQKLHKGTFGGTHGFLDASTDPARVVEMFEAVKVWGGSIVGVGLHLGPAELLAVDVDGADGLAAWLDDEHTPTFEVFTPSGGRHFWYRKPERANVSHSEHCLPGVDVVRSDEGFVVAPGIVTPWGEYVSHDDYPGAVATCPPEVWDVLDRTDGGGSPSSTGGVRVRGLERVLAELEAVGDREQDIETLKLLCSARYGGHDPFMVGDQIRLTRPGKRSGASASIGYRDPGVVIIFSTGWDQGGLAAHGHYRVRGDELVASDAVDDLMGDQATTEPGQTERTVDGDGVTERPAFVRASDVRSQRQCWAWAGRLPLGELTVVGGMEKLGKSTALVWATARLTCGELPGDLDGVASDVAFISGEDHYARTLKPRLVAAGAELGRVHLLDPEGPGWSLRAVVELAERVDLAMVVLDPLSLFISVAASAEHGEQANRKALEPLVRLAQHRDLAVAGVRHMRKAEVRGNPFDALMGSRAYTAAARSVLFFTPDREHEGRGGGLIYARGNLAVEPPAMRYRLEATTVLLDDGAVASQPVFVIDDEAVTARLEDVLGGADRSEGTAHDRASQWLEALLRGNGEPMEVTRIQVAAARAGHAWRTVRRAKDALGVTSKQYGFQGPHRWELPTDDHDDPQGASFETGPLWDQVDISGDDDASEAGEGVDL